MKLSISLTSLIPLLLVGSAQAVTSEISFTGTCNFDNVNAAVADEGEDLLALLGVENEDLAKVILERLCARAIANNSDEEIGACKYIL